MKTSQLILFSSFIFLCFFSCKKAGSILKVAHRTGKVIDNSNNQENKNVNASTNNDNTGSMDVESTYTTTKEVFDYTHFGDVDGYNCYKIGILLSSDTTGYLNSYAKKIPDLINISNKPKAKVFVDFYMDSPRFVKVGRYSTFIYKKGELVD